jgi:hypothetical protein
MLYFSCRIVHPVNRLRIETSYVRLDWIFEIRVQDSASA